MTESAHTEYMNLINLWNCTEPMTKAQLERMSELELLAVTAASVEKDNKSFMRASDSIPLARPLKKGEFTKSVFGEMEGEWFANYKA